MNVSRIALGTAQFGLAYGVANTAGQIDLYEAKSILNLATEAGLDTLDTAIAYGDSEVRLGKLGVRRWKVVSKLPGLPDEPVDTIGWVEAAVRGSAERLGVDRIHGLLLHRPRELLGANGDTLYRALVGVQEKGWVEKIGVSVYSPDDLENLSQRFHFDLVQIPLNIFDRRMISSGWVDRLNDTGVEVHARSAFLQGLLLMEPARRPTHFSRWERLWLRWQAWLAEVGITPLQACLGFVSATSAVKRIVVGVDSRAQLSEILLAANRPEIIPPSDLACHDLDLIDPSRWPR